MALVQSAWAAASGGTWAVTLGSGTAGDSSLIVWASGYNSSSAAMSGAAPTLGGGSVPGTVQLFSVQSATSVADTVWVAAWLLPDVPAGATAVAVAVTGSSSSADAASIWVAEFSGLGSSPVIGTSSTGSGTSGTSLDPGGVTAAAGTLVIGGAIAYGRTVTAPGSPWRAIHVTSTDYSATGWRVPASGTVDYACTIAAAAPWAAGIAVISPSFPLAPLDLRAELDLAGTWTDVTSLAYQREGSQAAADVTRGKPDESSQANPAAATFELNNRGGQFSPKDPSSPYFGRFGRNTPVRLSVPAQNNYLRLEAGVAARAYVSNDANLAISGSIDVRIQLALTDWQGCVLAAKWDGGGDWYWALNADGTLTFGWYDSSGSFHAVTSTAPVPFTRSQFAVRATMGATTGSVTFYASSTIGGTWTQLGAVSSGTGGAATSVGVSSGSPLAVGYSFNILSSNNLYGRVYEFQLRTGIGGTLVADGIFSAQAAGATSWTDAQGNAWQLTGGAEISSRNYRYHGECSALPPKWDASGNDVSVPVTTAGVLRRLGQGQSPVMSPMKRALLAQSGTLTCRAYWPCEDAKGATSFGSAVGGPPMQFTVSRPPSLAADTTFLASAALPTLSNSGWRGVVPSYSGAGSIVVRFLVKLGSSGVSTLPATGWPLVRVYITGGTCTSMDLLIFPGYYMGIQGSQSTAGSVFSGEYNFGWASGSAFWCSLELRPSGSTVNWSIEAFGPGAPVTGGGNGSFTGTVGSASAVAVHAGTMTDSVIGQVSVQSDWESLFNLAQPLNSWQGETAGARIARLCGENNVAARIVGSPGQSAPMGPQSPATLLQLLQECEDADRGLLYDSRHALGIGYRTYASLCAQSPAVTLDYSQATLGGGDSGVEPTYDDQYIRNDMTVTRGSTGGGSSAQGSAYQLTLSDGSPMSTGSPPGGVGDYSDSITVNVETDAMAADVAGWMVHVGTIDEARWPAIPVNLARAIIQSSGLYYVLLDLDVGDYVSIVNPPSWMTPNAIRQLAYGTHEKLGGIHHELELNGVPEAPYEVMLLDDPAYGHADTDGSALRLAATATATTLAVASAGLPWTTSAGDLPFDLAISGERVTVTAAGNGPSASATSPAAFAALATAALPPGTWLIGWTVALSGTTGSPEVNNFRLTDSSGATLAASVNASAAGTYPQQPVLVTISGSLTGVILKTGGNAATSGAVYTGTFTSPQALTVTRSVNGVVKAQSAVADVRLWHPPYLAIR